MSSEDGVRPVHATGPAVSRRNAVRLAVGATLASAAIGSLGGRAAFGATGTGGSLDASALLIHDGTPYWWLSPDIWTVPGTNPYGPPGTPTAGSTAYVWARVTNTSNYQLNGVELRYYWANPSGAMFFSTINYIGSAYVNLAPGAVQNVLCPTPWNVVFTNGGHECLVVAAILPSDPPLPDLIDVPGFPNVAQRNITVAQAPPKGKDTHLTVNVNAARDTDRYVTLNAKWGGQLADDVLATLGLKGVRAAATQTVAIGLSPVPVQDGGDIGKPDLDVVVPAGKDATVYLTLRGLTDAVAGEYQLVQVFETEQGRLTGGVSFAATTGQTG